MPKRQRQYNKALNLDQPFDKLRLPILIVTGDDCIVATERSIQ